MLCRKQEHLDRLILGGLICLRHQLLEKSFVACDSAPEVCPPFLQCKSLIPSARKRKRRSERARQRRSRSRTYLSSFDAPSRLVVHCQLMGLAFVSVPVYQWRHSSTSHMFADASGLPRAALQLGFLRSGVRCGGSTRRRRRRGLLRGRPRDIRAGIPRPAGRETLWGVGAGIPR